MVNDRNGMGVKYGTQNKMRQIKYRAKIVNGRGTGEWVYGTYAKHISNFVIFDAYTGERHIIDPTTLGQFIGLYDKNLIPIYEGGLHQEVIGNIHDNPELPEVKK